MRLRYDSVEKFAQHIQEFHQCSLKLGHIWHLSEDLMELIEKHCQFGREESFHRGLENKHQHLVDDFHSIHSQRWENLFNNSRKLKGRHDHSDGAGFASPPRSAQHIQPVQGPSELGLYTALSEEACIVDGLMVSSFFRPDSCFRNSKMPCYSLGDGIKVSRYELDGLCDSLLEATRLLRTDDTSNNPELNNGNLQEKSSSRAEIPKEKSRIIFMASRDLEELVHDYDHHVPHDQAARRQIFGHAHLARKGARILGTRRGCDKIK